MRTSRPSPLAEAAQAFEDELTRYAQLGEAFVRAQLATTKQLERANQAVDEIVAQEQRLGAAGQRLVAAVTEARQRQEALAQAVLDRLPEVRARNEAFRELLGELAAIGVETGELNERAAVISQGGAEAARHDPASRELATRMDALQARAGRLAERARDVAFEELASQAHALHQRLLAAWKKLDQAAPRPS
jgi:hypothetical protein